MTKPLYILDFDRTLFDTTAFTADLRSVLHRSHRVPGDRFDQIMIRYLNPSGQLYDLAAEAAALAGITATELQTLAANALAGRDYLFPDATDWLRRHQADQLAIITTGHRNFQTFKLQFAPTLHHLPRLIIPDNKAQYVASQISGQTPPFTLDFLDNVFDHIYLVDDNPDTFAGLLSTPGLTCIRLARPGQRFASQPTPSGITTITSFKEL